MKNTLLIVIFFLSPFFVKAQFIKEKSLGVQVGYGVTIPYYSEADVGGTGFFAQGEIIYKVTNWVELRPYAGLFITKADDEDFDGNPTDEYAESKAFLIGGKTRLRIPIPYIAPYIEVGFGASIGSFKTSTVFDYYDKKGVIYHIPISFGLELGKNNGVDIGFSYFLHNSVEQQSGAFALGLSFPLK